MEALSELGIALQNHIEMMDEKSVVVAQIDRVRTQTQNFFQAEYVDGIHLAKNLATAKLSPDIVRACKSFQSSLHATIIRNRVPRKSRKLKNANGLSIWFPATTFSFVVNRSKYLEIRGVESHGGWLAFLDEFFSILRR